ncbi:MAG: hypothetical protein ACI8X5_002776 [Planctomycetota bacterium]|jgi:hypothetical protein
MRLLTLCLFLLLGAPIFAIQEDPSAKERFTTDRESPVKLPLAEEDDSFIFAVFGDRTGGPSDGVKILAQAVEDVNLIDPDLVMTVGDLVQGYNQTEGWQKQADEFTGIMQKLTSPWYPVAGNHDVYWRGEGRPETEHDANYERHFGPLWYAFRHKDCWFVVLYTDEGNPTTGKKDFHKPAEQRMSPAQLAFLDKTLERTKDARHVFVFLHHPRWHGGQYGDDWEQVHQRLATAGNVTAVFAGHIHHMVYDGVRDGIEYFTLATVGGSQPGIAAEAGYLHHWNLVTVRDGKIAVATFPVGAVIDPRMITADVAADARRIANDVHPEFLKYPRLEFGQPVDEQVSIQIHNPLERALEITLNLGSADIRWQVTPDHHHSLIPPGEARSFDFRALRNSGTVDPGFQSLAAELQFEYLEETHRVSMPLRTVRVPTSLDTFPTPMAPKEELAFAFDGKDDCLAVNDEDLALPDGPLTLECRFNADSFAERVGLLNKTENGEYGFFLDRGQASFFVHLNGAYAAVNVPDLVLETGRWYHIAGVFDGQALRLYLDGKLMDETAASGKRTMLRIPLLVGADTDGKGAGNSYFDGRIDEVRLSKVARYTSKSFSPADRHEADMDTVLLLHLDERIGEWAFDSAPSHNHPELRGQPRLVPAD